MPPDLREWVPKDDLCHFIVGAVERVAIGQFKINHRGSGSKQYSTPSCARTTRAIEKTTAPPTSLCSDDAPCMSCARKRAKVRFQPSSNALSVAGEVVVFM